MTTIEWLVLVGGIAAIGLVIRHFFVIPGREQGGRK
jgi:hypothetical protein